MNGLQEHNDFHYSSIAEISQADAELAGTLRPEADWTLSDWDVWYENPSYDEAKYGPRSIHPDHEDGIAGSCIDELGLTKSKYLVRKNGIFHEVGGYCRDYVRVVFNIPDEDIWLIEV